MANALYGNILYANAVGILSDTALNIMGVNFVPNAVADAFDLNFWDEGNPVSGANRALGNVTITSTTTITDADTGGVLTGARYPATNVLKIFKTIEGGGNGSTANHDYHLIETAGDNNVIVTAATLTNEDNKSYKFDCYPSRPFLNGLQPTAANTHYSMYWYFGPYGVRVPNLILEAISTSAYLEIYLAPVL
jgi:hypothetical protein